MAASVVGIQMDEDIVRASGKAGWSVKAPLWFCGPRCTIRDLASTLSLSAGGSWSGNTFRVTIRAFNGKITKSASLTASVTATPGKVTLFDDYGVMDVTIDYYINGVKKSTTSSFDTVDVSAVKKVVWNSARSVCVYTSGAKYIYLPKTNSYPDSEKYDISATYDNGYDAGKKDYRPDYITQSGNKVTVHNAAGDSLGTYSVADYPSLQDNRTHTTTVSSTTTLTITPSSGYSAMKKATITINVSSSGGGSGGCFAAGSPVRLADGTEVAIEDLKVGMMLAAYDEETQEIVETEVESVQQYKHKDQIYDIRFTSGTRLTLTHSHPLLTTHGWCAIDPEAALKEHTYMQEIGRLVIGDTVITRTGTAVVEDVFRREDLMDETVYNIDAEPYDNFFVSDILAHNAKSET